MPTNPDPRFATKQTQTSRGMERRLRRARLKLVLKQRSTRAALEDAVAAAEKRGFIKGGMVGEVVGRNNIATAAHHLTYEP